MKYVRFASIKRQGDCAWKCINIKYATHAMWMTNSVRGQMDCICIFDHEGIGQMPSGSEELLLTWLTSNSRVDLSTCISDFKPYTLGTF